MVERLRGRAGQAQRRRRLLRTDGLCEMCSALDRTAIATVVDHIVPLAKGGSDEDSNTRNLCDEHHREVSVIQFEQHAAMGARGIGRSGRPISPDHPWNRRPYLAPFDAAMADVYAARTGEDAKTIASLMDAETFMSGTQAIERGFADSLLPADQLKTDDSAKASDRHANELRAMERTLLQAGHTREEARARVDAIRGKREAIIVRAGMIDVLAAVMVPILAAVTRTRIALPSATLRAILRNEAQHANRLTARPVRL